MMSSRFGVPCVLALGTILSTASAQELHPISIAEPATVTLPGTDRRPELSVTVEYDLRGDCGLSNDCLILSLKPRSRGALKPAHAALNSSYGAFRLFLADLTGDGVEEVVTVTGEGRGTFARREFLTVRQWSGNGLRELLRTVVSEYFGPGEMWRYEPRFEENPEAEAVELFLDLRHDEPTPNRLTSPDLIPTAQHLHFVYDASAGALKAGP